MKIPRAIAFFPLTVKLKENVVLGNTYGGTTIPIRAKQVKKALCINKNGFSINLAFNKKLKHGILECSCLFGRFKRLIAFEKLKLILIRQDIA